MTTVVFREIPLPARTARVDARSLVVAWRTP